jgi:hypothetical protein
MGQVQAFRFPLHLRCSKQHKIPLQPHHQGLPRSGIQVKASCLVGSSISSLHICCLKSSSMKIMLSGVLWVQWRPWSRYTVLGYTCMDKILQLLHCWWLEGVAPWRPGCRVKSSPESSEFYCSRFAPLFINMRRHHLPFMFLWMEHLQSPLFVPLLQFCLNWTDEECTCFFLFGQIHNQIWEQSHFRDGEGSSFSFAYLDLSW